MLQSELLISKDNGSCEQSEGKKMKDIFFFDGMLTPKIITFVYWLMLLGVLIAGFGAMFSDFGSFKSGLMILVGGAVGSRIWCELLIVLFKIHENLQKLADKSEG